MNQTIKVWVGEQIIYLYGTVNGVAETFTLVGAGYWQAEVPRSENQSYVIHLEAYSANGLEGAYDYVLYYGMQPLVTDRTLGDVQNRTVKGFYNASDLNRVGSVVQYLSDTLEIAGYTIIVSPKTDWTITDIPRPEQMTAYLDDVEALKAGFYGTTPLPDSMNKLWYWEANDIEKLLLEIEEYINRMKAGYRKSGTFKSGQGVILP